MSQHFKSAIKNQQPYLLIGKAWPGSAHFILFYLYPHTSTSVNEHHISGSSSSKLAISLCSIVLFVVLQKIFGFFQLIFGFSRALFVISTDIFLISQLIFSISRGIFLILRVIFSISCGLFFISQNIFSTSHGIFSPFQLIFCLLQGLFSISRGIFSVLQFIFSGSEGLERLLHKNLWLSGISFPQHRINGGTFLGYFSVVLCIFCSV